MLIGSEQAEEPAEETEASSGADVPGDEPQPERHDSQQNGPSPTPPVVAPIRGRSRLWMAAAAILLVLLVVETVLYFAGRSRIDHLESLQSAQSSALATARTDSLAIASYDYRHLQAEFAHVESLCTPSFAVSYAQSSKPLETILGQFHATATATVLAVGAESVSTTRVVVLVFVNQTVTNNKYKTSTADQRLEVTLVHEHGRWLIDNLVLP